MLGQMEENKAKQAEYEAWLMAQKEGEVKKAKAVEDEKIAKFLAAQNEKTDEPSSKRGKLGSFWVPSEAPKAVDKTEMQIPDNKIYCKANGDKVHTVSLKRLYPVTFERVGDEAICPSCKETIKNFTNLSALIPCGHTLCCLGEGEMTCLVCEVEIKKKIDLARDGTGFAAGGGTVEVKKYDVPFQC